MNVVLDNGPVSNDNRRTYSELKPVAAKSGTMRVASAGRSEGADVTRTDLMPCPIRPEWILEGTPVARALKLAGAADGNLNCSLWDCTKGKFRWHFRSDEIVHILEGSVRVRDDETGIERLLGPGDVAMFPQGTTSVWEVNTYVKKLAIIRSTESVTRQVLRVIGF